MNRRFYSRQSIKISVIQWTRINVLNWMNGKGAFYRNNQLFGVQTRQPTQEIYPNYHNYSLYSLMNHYNSSNKKQLLFMAAIVIESAFAERFNTS